MTTEDTVQAILGANTWNARIQQIRLVPQRHGTGEVGAIYAAVARKLYMRGADTFPGNEVRNR